MSSRPIAPMPSGNVRPRRDGEGGDWPVASGRVSRRTSQACNSCRQLKQKCNGARPQCHNCTARNVECIYVEEKKARIKALEAVVHTLQTGSDHDAENLVRTMRSGAVELPHASSTLNLARWPFPIPSPSTAEKAVDGFFSCSGKLFHVFSRPQVTRYYQEVFGEGSINNVNDDTKAAACCLTAVAAVGCQYAATMFDVSVEIQFYETARYYFEAILELRPLDGVKICTLLALYNIMKKATIALAYVEIGLSLARRLRLDDKAFRNPAVDAEDWVDYRKSWRTLMFFSSWLSSTLGYISGNDLVSQNLILSEMEIESSADISDIAQSEMAKISLLKAEIFRVHLAFRELTIPVVADILENLQTWHSKLPEALHLSRLREQAGTYEVNVRRCIYHVHLLYLGAIILLHRRVASQFIRQYSSHSEARLLPNPLTSVVDNVAEQGILAAKQTASIVKLLHDENGVYKRCWLVIFQSYASCIIILQSVAQKQLIGFDRPSWAGDLDSASRCLAALHFCREADPAAAKFANKLTPLYEMLKRRSDSAGTEPQSASYGGSSSIPTVPSANGQPGAGYLFHIPQNLPNQRVFLSFSLMELLCRPFGDPDTLVGATEDIKLGERVGPTRGEYAQMVERLQINFETTTTFKWDSSVVELADSGEIRSTGNHFLDGVRPNGWSSEPGTMRRDPD